MHVKLEMEDSSALNLMGKLTSKNAVNYFIMSGKESADLNERLGYVGADLMLYAQTLGLNTWWIGGTFSKKNVERKVPNQKVIGIIVVGYGENAGKRHKQKDVEAVSSYEGETPDWFVAGVSAACTHCIWQTKFSDQRKRSKSRFEMRHLRRRSRTCEVSL